MMALRIYRDAACCSCRSARLVAASIGILVLGLFTGPVPGQESEEEVMAALREAAARLDREFEEETAKLAALREKIAETKPALAIRFEETASLLRQKQREYDIARSTREAVTEEFDKAEKQLTFWRDERAYIDGLLHDCRKNLEATSTLASAEAMRDRLLAADESGDEGTSARLDLVARAIEELGRVGGARSFCGKALGPDGILREGTVVEAGPVSWFASESDALSGLLVDTPALIPEVLVDTAERSDIVALAMGKDASPRFDPTMGTAVALEEVEASLLEHIRKGGFWIYPILSLGAIALLTALFKLFAFARLREVGTGVVRSVVDRLNSGESEAASRHLEAINHPAAEVLRCGVEHAELSRDDLEEKMYEKHVSLLPKIQRGLPFVAIAAATAPLLGLLGTVTGMIRTFQKITVFGTGDAKPLAGGISEALVTTEFGLIVAIPSLIIHSLLARRAAGIRANMEMSSLAFLNGIKPQADR